MSVATVAVNDVFAKLLTSLTEKERDVLKRRIGLVGTRQTLQMIGDSYSITRERVRQIEEMGISKLGRLVKNTDLARIQESAKDILSLMGGVATREKLVSAVVRTLALEKNTHLGVVDTVIQACFDIQKSKPQLGVHPHFFLPSVNRKLIQDIGKEGIKILKKRGDIMEMSIMTEMIRVSLFAKYGKVSDAIIDSVSDVFMDYVKGEDVYVGLKTWKILNPTTLKDKAVYVLKKDKVPMHFVEITNAIQARFEHPVKVATVHNELIRNEEFVLIGRGIYVLKAWGYKSGNVLDVVVEILEKNKGPMATTEIVNKVLKTRQVKASTIYMNLQNRKIIARVGRNMYDLKARVKAGK